MKKLLLASFVIVLVGAGCFGGGGEEENKIPEIVEGDWVIAFDLPEGWIMSSPYNDGDFIKPNNKIEKLDTDVILQSTELTLVRGGNVPEEIAESGLYKTDDYVFISVLHLDKRRIIPSEAEDLGNGFSKLDLCLAAEDCDRTNFATMQYYLQTEEGKYQFNVSVNNRDLSEAEAVILTAKETTN